MLLHACCFHAIQLFLSRIMSARYNMFVSNGRVDFVNSSFTCTYLQIGIFALSYIRLHIDFDTNMFEKKGDTH